MMTERLKQALEKSGATLGPEEQDHLADELLARLAQEKNALAQLLQLLDDDAADKWDALFAENSEKFEFKNATADIAVGNNFAHYEKARR